MHVATSVEIFDLSLVEGLQCMIFPGRGVRCLKQYENHYRSLYRFWKTMVSTTLFKEINIKEPHVLHSDQFTRQEEIVSLFKDEKPIGMFMFDWRDMRFASTKDHSYFEHYPKQVTDKLCKEGYSLVMTMAYLLVDRDWRKSAIGRGIADILVGFATTRFLETDASLLITYTRNDRKTNELGFRAGGISISAGHMAFSCESDVLIFKRENVRPSPYSGIPEAVEKLWNSKVIAIKNSSGLR